MDLFSTKVAYASAIDTFMGKVDAQIINPLILLLFALALAYFLYGVFEFIANWDNEENRTTGKTHMLWGIVGLAIMIGVWFILGAIVSTFNLQGTVDPQNGKVTLPASPN